MRRILFALIAGMTLMSCSHDGQRILVLYYSQTGTTQSVAEQIGAQLGADVVRFDVDAPYDGTYDQTVERGLRELRAGVIPFLAPLEVDPDDYDVIFLGFPVWFGTYAQPVASLIDDFSFDGKTVVPFCTFGSGGLGACTSALREALPKADVRDGYGVRASRLDAAPEEIRHFLAASGFLEGIQAEKCVMSPRRALSESDVAVFDAACASYTYPLGTPSWVESCRTDGADRYVFTIEGTSSDPDAEQTCVYVTDPDGDSLPEIVMVER